MFILLYKIPFVPLLRAPFHRHRLVVSAYLLSHNLLVSYRQAMASEPQCLPGPEIDGRETKLYLFEADQLAASPLLPGFLPPINSAFSACHPPWLPASMVRMHTTDQFLKELGQSAFTYGVVFSDDTRDPKEVIATVSGAPWTLRTPEEQDSRFRTFYYDETHVAPPNTETWQLKLMVVDPRLQKNGLASLMLGLVETEIRRRFEAKKLGDAQISSPDGKSALPVAQRKLRLLLQTLYEMNGGFYAKRGWKLINLREREKGFMDSERGFHVAFMEKTFDF